MTHALPSTKLPIEGSAPAHAAAIAAAQADPVRFERHEEIQADLEELARENQWPAIVERYHPLDEKAPAAAAGKRSHYLRSRVAFALGQTSRFDEGIAELRKCLEQYPGNFLYHAAMAYTAYNSLWAAKNREYFLKGPARKDRIDLAHAHFKRAQELRPDGVTNFYRQGMLFYKIEDHAEKAFPLFRMAVANWDGLSPQEQQARHQERKNFVKALYQAASAALKLDRPSMALGLIERCLAEDEASGHLERLFKFFALGKVRYHLGQYDQARDALKFALQVRRKGQPADFASELLARTYMALKDFNRAETAVQEIPEHRRRPYIRWTEADILTARGRADEARKVLLACADKDRMSRHKALIRLAKLEHQAGRFEHAEQCAAVADRFFREKWGNPYLEGLYWQALSALGMGNTAKARAVLGELEAHFPESGRCRMLQEQMAETGS